MTENLDFFKIQHNSIQPQKGKVLVSEPFLQDSYFKRSVVLITEHNNNGTVGFVLNRPIDFLVDEIIKDFPSINSLVTIGGPVRMETIQYIHTLGHIIPDCEKIMDQVYWGGDIDAIKAGITAGWIKDYQIRFFVGYSSWQPGQLAREIEENSWLVTAIDRLDVMHGSDQQLWTNTLKKEDEKYQLWARYPEDPAWN